MGIFRTPPRGTFFKVSEGLFLSLVRFFNVNWHKVLLKSLKMFISIVFFMQKCAKRQLTKTFREKTVRKIFVLRREKRKELTNNIKDCEIAM